MCKSSKTTAIKIEKMPSKLLTDKSKYFGRWSSGHASRVRQGSQGMLACEHVRSQATLIREYISTQSMLTCNARKHSRHVGT